MEIDFVITLRASLTGWPPVAHSTIPSDFIDRLNIRPEDKILEVYIEPERGTTALVDFLRLNVLNRDRGEVGGWENLYVPVQEHIADWLRARDNALFEEFRKAGLKIDFYVAVAMNQDQFQLKLCSKFLAACGEKGLDIDFITNDFPAGYLLENGYS